MKHENICGFLSRSIAVALLFGLCSVCAVNAAPQSTTEAATPETITDTTPNRLLAHIAVGKLQDVYGVPITYEDTRQVHESEIDRSVPFTSKPEGRSITYTFTPPSPDADFATRKKMAGEVLADVVHKCNAARGMEMFRIIEIDNGFHIVATKFLNASGKMEDLQPIFDTPITLAPGERTGQDVLDEIAQQIDAAKGWNSPAGFGFWWPGGVRPNAIDHKVNISATNEPARSVLDRLFKALPINASKKNPSVENRWDPVPASWSWELVLLR